MVDGPDTETAQLYANVLDEIKARLGMVAWALQLEQPDNNRYIAVSDLCCLQFRKIFEAIALGCLVVHGDAPGTKRLKEDVYRADKLLKVLGKLHPDFYPSPCKIVMKPDGNLRALKAIDGEWLKKDLLMSLYRDFDHEMHVGTLTRRSLKAEPYAPDYLLRVFQWTIALLKEHIIDLRNPNMRIVARLEGDNGSPHVSIQLRRR